MNRAWSKLIPASAGSGKTYTLMKLLSHGLTGQAWSADPESGEPALPEPLSADRLVAVTFTEAAAQELKQRIRGDLLRVGRVSEAAQLDDAYVSTIHSFGLRLLRETAFDRGEALSPRLLTEDEQKQLLRRTLGHSRIIDDVTADLGRFGYRYDFNSGASAADAFRQRVLDVIELMNACGGGRSVEELISACQAHAARVYGSVHEHDAGFLESRLRERIAALLDAFPHSLAESHGTNATAKKAFASNFRDLMTARDTDRLRDDWALWVSLCDLRKSVGKCPTPDGYDELADGVMSAASAIHRHPGPLATAQEHIEILLRAAHDASERYTEFKRQAGLLDYSDMVANAQVALCDDRLMTLATGRVDCVVVDEFQDTNPQQFGLLWHFMRSEVPSVIVGDMKQSIMGFQGADPRLFQALLQGYPELTEPLNRNWRSQPRLMDFINAVSRELFPDYRDLEPQGKPSDLPALHVLAMPDRPHIKTDHWRGARIAEAIARKLKDPEYIIADRHTGHRRRLRGGDCAVLCPSHKSLARYAEALRAQGLKVRLKESGWIDTDELRIALAALALIQDPDDRHARLYLAVTDLGQHTLDSALRIMVAGDELTDPCFERLAHLTADAQRLTVDQLVPSVLEAIGLYDAVLHWPGGRQARANLLKLEGLAKEFVDAQPESRMAAGIFGTGLPQFLCWVHQQAENANDMPPASTIDEDAVELVTWHASKGREWPIVAVCGWAQKIEPRLPDLRLEYPDFEDLDRLIGSAQIAWSPDFDSPEARERVKQHLVDDEVAETLREIYVAITRPRDQLLLEWPLDALSAKYATRASLLNERIRLKLEANSVVLGSGEAFDSIAETAEAPENEEAATTREPMTECFGRIALEPGQWTGPLTPDSRSPSVHDEVAAVEILNVEEIQYGKPLELPPHPDVLTVGTFVHRCFEVGFNSERTRAYLSTLAEDLWPTDHVMAIEAIQASVDAFQAALQTQLGGHNIRSEVPVSGLDTNNIVVNGIVDMLAETEGGLLIIDHKSDRGIGAGEMLRRHVAQLGDYAELLNPTALKGLAINAVMLGTLIIACKPETQEKWLCDRQSIQDRDTT